MNYLYKILFLCFCTSGLSDIPFRTTEPFLPKLNQELDLSSINGTVNILLLKTLSVGDRFTIKLLDGKVIKCIIKETNIFDNKQYYFGNDINNEDDKFGFFINPEDRAEGAILIDNKKILYKMFYSENLKGYYFAPQISL
jgi:hypothetical protein